MRYISHIRMLRTVILASTMVFHQQFSLADNKLFDQENRATAGLLHLLSVAEVHTENNDLTSINQAIKNAKWDTPRTERWDLCLPPKLENKANEIIDICHNELGMGPTILPSKQQYDGVLFLGAAMSRVVNRINFYNRLTAQGIINPKLKLWVLTGERQLNPRAGETEEALKQFLPQAQATLPNNEPEMIKLLFSYMVPSSVMVEYISSGKDPNHTRATTESTIIAFLEKYPKSEQKLKFLGISNQPFVLYQELVIERILNRQNRDDVEIEVIGDQAENNKDANNYAATLLSTVAKNTSLLSDITIEKTTANPLKISK